MIDFAASFVRIRGMLTRPAETLADHVDPVPPWQVVAREHAAPLIVGSAVISTILLILFQPMLTAAGVTLATTPELLFQLVVRVIMNLVMLAVMASVVAFFAGMFGGSNDFNASFTLVALAMTPLYVGEAIMPLPGLGVFAALAGLIYSLVILFRGSVVALGLPPRNRGQHFALSLLSVFLISMLSALVLGPFLVPQSG